MVTDDRGSGQTSAGKRQGQAAIARLTHSLFLSRKFMAAKRKPSKQKVTSAKATAQPSPAASVLAMATHNVVNMVAIATISAAVLLTLLAIKHY